MIRIIAFDADDTLWENEIFFHDARVRFVSLLRCFSSESKIISEFEEIEKQNVKVYGYGIKSHTLSMVETALKLSNNTIDTEIISEIIDIGKDIYNKPLNLFSGVEDVLKYLYFEYKLIIITKGDLLDQTRKIELSGLSGFFSKTFVVSEKSEKEYFNILKEMGIREKEFLMVGNSLKSDIVPVINIGGNGVYVPHSYICHHEIVEEEIIHDNLFQINNISELKKLDLISLFSEEREVN